MGSGKTTLGKMLAGRLDYHFIDMDKEIEQEQQMSINEIFSARGESFFRDREETLLKRLITRDNIVVSTGGGVPCYRDNMSLIKSSGVSVYLKMDREMIFNRLVTEQAERPLIKDMNPGTLYDFVRIKLAEREPFYRQADIIVDTMDINPDELLTRILNQGPAINE
jgi:shikimate kinase